VTLHWIDITMMAAMVLAGGVASYFLLLGRLRHVLAENQRETERRLAALTEALVSRAATAEQSPTDALVEAEIEAEPVPVSARIELRASASAEPVEQQEQDIPPQIQAAIAAAAIAVLGNHARVRSARRVPSSNVVSPWTQQGRVIVQSSHNLRTQASR